MSKTAPVSVTLTKRAKHFPQVDVSTDINEKTQCLLLVEGIHDQGVLQQLIQAKNLPGFQVHSIDGQGSLKDLTEALDKTFRLISKSAQTHKKLNSIGIILDADDDPEGAFKLAKTKLTDYFSNAPVTNGLTIETKASLDPDSKSMIRLGILIIPAIDKHGALESLFLETSSKKEPAWSLSQDFATRIEQQIFLKPGQNIELKPQMRDKLKLRSYLLAHPSFPPTPASGFRSGNGPLWKAEDSAFNCINDFLAQLMQASSSPSTITEN